MYVKEKLDLIHLLINELIDRTHHQGTEVPFKYSAWINQQLHWAEGPIQQLQYFYEEQEEKRRKGIIDE